MDYTFYRIKCIDKSVTDCYIGSSKNYYKRCSVHRSNCKDLTNTTPVYQFIRSHGGWDNWVVEIIDVVTFDKKSALLHERALITFYNSKLNVSRPIISEEEKKEYKTKRAEEAKSDNAERKTDYEAYLAKVTARREAYRAKSEAREEAYNAKREAYLAKTAELRAKTAELRAKTAELRAKISAREEIRRSRIEDQVKEIISSILDDIIY
jgi:flagellar biosynthesis GTPase FlhF